MPSKKRSRPDADESRAECPFTVRQRPPTTAELTRYQEKKARREPIEDDKKAEWHWQASPFNPTGFQSMDLKYAINPIAQWSDMTRYNSFVLGKEKFHTDDFVFVANEESVKRQKSNEPAANGQASQRDRTDWVAKILEIRALNEQHVYARVYWMYWPDELPPGTQIGRKTIRGGRQPYHGKHELIASNHMDVINAVSVTMAADVNHWIETDEEDTQPALYWRQAFNCNTACLSMAKDICKCETPANPDKMLVRCSSSTCGKWMHDDCLRHDGLLRVFERLGKNKPQVFDDNEQKQEGMVSPPATDSENKGNDEVAQNDIKLPVFSGPQPAPEKITKKGAKKEPYRGLFEANIRLNEGPTSWQVKDLRNIEGGAKAWLEKAHCLFCNSTIE